MMRRSTDSVLRIILVGMFVVSLCVFCSCKPAAKQQAKGTDTSAPETTGTDSGSKQVAPSTKDTAAETTKPAEQTTEKPAAQATTEKPAEQATEKPAEQATETPAVPAGYAPIPLELPKPMFVGTPQDTRVENLRKPLGKPRPPFMAPEGTTNVALHKPVKATDEEPIIGELEMITDGDKEAADGSYVELGPFVQNVTIDLQGEYNIYAVVVWHYHKQARVYYDVICQVADDPDFITNVKTLFNNDIDNSAGQGIGTDQHYIETNEGLLIDAKGVKAHYVRLYSNGNTSNDLNHYIEVEVYGKPAK